MTEQSYEGVQAVSIRRLKEHVGEEVLVQGWLYNMRSKGKLHFLLVRDGSGTVQSVMFKGNVSEEEFEAAGHLDAGVERARDRHRQGRRSGSRGRRDRE